MSAPSAQVDLTHSPCGRTTAVCARTDRPVSTNFVEKPSLEAAAMCVSGGCQRGKLSLSASCGEDWRRERDELRQFPQILGCGGQQELVLGSIWAAEAQATEPEDALQMSEEHLNLLSFAT